MRETKSLKSLSDLVLERNKKRNKTETNCQNFVSQNFESETKKDGFLSKNFIFSSLIEDVYEERLAIAQYDGKQESVQAYRVAYLDAFVSALTILPYKDMLETAEKDWLVHSKEEWLKTKCFS